MGFLSDKWNKNKFSIYDSEEKTVLKLIENIKNFLGNDIVKEVDNKTDLNGNHLGQWQGLNKPTLSEEGTRATVEKHIEDIKNINLNVGTIENNTGIVGKSTGNDYEQIQLAINQYDYVKLTQGEEYTINQKLKLGSNKTLDLNGSTIKASNDFLVYDKFLITFDNGIGLMFTNSKIINGVLNCNGKTGGILARGPVDLFNISNLYISKNIGRAIHIVSRNRVFGQESEGNYGVVSSYGAEGFTIERVKILPLANLESNYCLSIEDSNEFTLRDIKIFGNIESITPNSVNAYGLEVTQRISTNCYYNGVFEQVAIAGFSAIPLRIARMNYITFKNCTFEALNGSMQIEDCKSVTFDNTNRFLNNSGFTNLQIDINNSSFSFFDFTNHSFSEVNSKLKINLNQVKYSDLLLSTFCEYTNVNSNDITIKHIKSNRNDIIPVDKVYGDLNYGYINFELDNLSKNQTVVFRKSGIVVSGIDKDGNIMFKNGARLYSGSGSPEGVISSAIGSIYIRTNPTTANEVIYVKASGYNTNTGWIGK